jgi:hypothetical protein
MSRITAPAHFELRGPCGRMISAALGAPDGLDGEWTLDLLEAGTEIVATYDSAAHVLVGAESFDAYPPFDLSSVSRGRRERRASREPYTAIAAVWSYLVLD